MKRQPLKAAGPGADNLGIALSRNVRTVCTLIFNTSGPYISRLSGSAEEACFHTWGVFFLFEVDEIEVTGFLKEMLYFGDITAYVSYEQ